MNISRITTQRNERTHTGDPIFQEIEYQAWSERAAYYDAIFAAVSTQAIDDILEALEPVQDKRHLDVACGTGHLVAAASRRGAISEGVDFAPAMVAAARENYPVELFQVADAMSLPYADGTFDLVTCSFGLAHMADPPKALAEAFRVLKAGGRLAFTLWYGPEDGNTSQAIFKAAVDQHASADFKLPESWTRLRNTDPETCEALARQAGFRGPVFKRLPVIWQVRSAQEVIDFLLRMSVRTRTVIEQQPAAVQGRIYQQIRSEVKARRVNGFIPLDWPALLTVVQKPHMQRGVQVSKRLEPKHDLYDSLEEMLAPKTLSELLAQPVKKVAQQPMEDHVGVAGGKLSHVDTDAGRFVLKQMATEHDWLMYTSNDQQCRSITLWQYGLLDEMRPHLEHKIIACGRDGAGWAILMHNLNDGLFGWWENSIPPRQVPVFLDRLARLHAAFWNDPRLEDPRLGLNSPASRLDLSSQELAQDHQGDQRGPIPEWVRDGWKIMETAIDRDVFLELSRLREDPQPLFDAMARYPYTLVHGDYRDANLAFLEPDQPVAFDWQQATRSLMTLDVAWFTRGDYVRNAMGKTGAIRYYRERLERTLELRFPDEDWQAMMDLGNLYDDLFVACLDAYFSVHADTPEHREIFERNLAERNQQVRDGMRWL